MVHLGVSSLLLLCFQLQGHSAIIPLPVERETGCYGNTADDFLEPKCNRSKIAVSKVFAMTKKADTMCPYVATALDRDEPKCCTVSPEDCKMMYETESGDILQDKCTGLENCKVPIAWMSTTCNTTEYIHRSNYMLMEFHCIPDALILPATPGEDGITSGRAVYLQNTVYPTGSDIGGACSVTSSCKTTLAISVIHMNVVGDCNHVIQVTDDGEDKYINCSRNNDDNYVIADVYYSSSHFLILNLDGAGVTNSGPLWIQVRGLNQNATVELRCGASAVSLPAEVDECPVELEETTASSVTSPTETGHHHPSSDSTPHTSTSSPPAATEGSTGIIIGVVVGLIVLVVGLIVGYFIYKKLKKSKGREPEKGSRPADSLGQVYDNVALNEDGLPPYIYTAAGKEEVVRQTHPLQTLLICSEVKPPPTPQEKPVRVATALRRFGQESNIVYPGSGPLPLVRDPKQPQPIQDSSFACLDQIGANIAGKFDSDSLMNNTGKLETNGLADSEPSGALSDKWMSQPVEEAEQYRSHKEKRKKKKKKKKLEPDGGDPKNAKKKKKKKKKDKKTSED